ncbi:MAG: SCO1664 family protein [Chloroflexi bacterium]|nr:SCO1664 family protein [Chloroflexota bacterium]
MPTNRADSVLGTLRKGTLTLKGEFLWGSNHTYLAQVEHAGVVLLGVYKPTRGERPLWDFPQSTLAGREVAAYLVSEALRWELVPPTVYRSQGPLGPGSLQLFVEHDPEYHYFNFSEADRQRLRPAALFDLLVNNADRKSTHFIIGADRHIWLIDHGICFHVENKLRTVVWDFAGEAIPEDLSADIKAFRVKLDSSAGTPSTLAASLRAYLSRGEIAALAQRAERLLAAGRFPDTRFNRRPYPWPPV